MPTRCTLRAVSIRTYRPQAHRFQRRGPHGSLLPTPSLSSLLLPPSNLECAPANRSRPPRRQRAYSLLEMLVTILITQVIAMMVVVNISDVEASERADRAAQQTIVALRYARMLAMATGQPTGVEFDTTTQKIRVFQGSGATAVTVTNHLLPGGANNYLIDLGSATSVHGTKIQTVQLIGATTNPYQCLYGTFGSTNNNGSITFACGKTRTQVDVNVVGDPRIH